MYYTEQWNSPLGRVTLASDGNALTGLWFDGQKYDQDILKGKETVQAKVPVFAEVKSWLERYFAGERPEIWKLPIKMNGSDFRKEVWRILCQIPYGQVATYGEIAKKMETQMGKNRMSAQAVGGAVAHNPVSIIVPCHRVVGANGELTGYAGGIDRKRMLLEHENVPCRKESDGSRYFVR